MEPLLGWTEGYMKLGTKGLEVGQVVFMTSGDSYLYGCCCWGEVVEVGPDGALVGAVVRSEIRTNITDKGQLLRFDSTGLGLECGTHEFGPWQLTSPALTNGQTFLEYINGYRRRAHCHWLSSPKKVKLATQLWQEATPTMVRKWYTAAGMKFNEAVLFSPVEFALLPVELEIAIYESEEFRLQWERKRTQI